MADFSIDIDALTTDDRVTINIGTTPGDSDVFTVTYLTTGSKGPSSFTPTAATLYLDILGFDNFTDAHTIRVDNVSITDGSERISNGDFTTDLTGWTQVVATIAQSTGQMLMTGFGGPAAPTIARQSFESSFTAATPGGHFVRQENLSEPILPPKGKEFKQFNLAEIQEDGQATIDRWIQSQVDNMRASNPMEQEPGPPPKTRRRVKFREL